MHGALAQRVACARCTAFSGEVAVPRVTQGAKRAAKAAPRIRSRPDERPRRPCAPHGRCPDRRRQVEPDLAAQVERRGERIEKIPPATGAHT